VRVALGTDSFCGFGSFGENTIVEAERSVAAGIAPQKVLEMATKNAGLHLGNDALGMIAPGRIADLIIVDGDPTTNIGDLRNVAMVIKDGKIQIDKMRKD
jgi:imidazolonepropionase-like amidohydrolase